MWRIAILGCVALVSSTALGQAAIDPATEESPTLTVTPPPISLPLRRADGEDVRLLAQLLVANKVESLLELAVRFAGVVEQQAAQIEALKAAIVERDERLKGIEARLSALEGK